MSFDITPYVHMSPAEVRSLIRQGKIDFPTAGMCAGYAQANPFGDAAANDGFDDFSAGPTLDISSDDLPF